MSYSRFAPRDHTGEPSGYGRIQTLRWNPAETAEATVQLAAAQLQHQFGLVFRQHAAARGLPLKSYASAVGMKYARLCRVLRGEVVMQVEDMVTAAAYFGFNIAFPPSVTDD